MFKLMSDTHQVLQSAADLLLASPPVGGADLVVQQADSLVIVWAIDREEA